LDSDLLRNILYLNIIDENNMVENRDSHKVNYVILFQQRLVIYKSSWWILPTYDIVKKRQVGNKSLHWKESLIKKIKECSKVTFAKDGATLAMHTTKRLNYLCSKGVTNWWKDIENCWCACLQSSGPKVLFVWVPRAFVDCK